MKSETSANVSQDDGLKIYDFYNDFVFKWPFDLPGQAQGPILSVTERSRSDR
ncbi:MAG TPA: hypothetical protein PLM07_01365 [Candidatus Rifleibacterium sp.]|nr:hypothetical protein [Candidatus Rifleibacterium sp.]HPT44526.1 hypothetical protein [Candidatus Rifleibacterium sp.]